MDTSFMLRDAMREFSPDGFWWWDGATWRPSSDIELTPVTEFERSGKLERMRDRLKRHGGAVMDVLDAEDSVGIDFVGTPLIGFSLFTHSFAYPESPTLRVVFAATPTQVHLIPKSGILMSGMTVVCGGRRWDLHGLARVFHPYPVMRAWWSATAAATAPRS